MDEALVALSASEAATITADAPTVRDRRTRMLTMTRPVLDAMPIQDHDRDTY